jgi:hypothetical protein
MPLRGLSDLHAVECDDGTHFVSTLDQIEVFEPLPDDTLPGLVYGGEENWRDDNQETDR